MPYFHLSEVKFRNNAMPKKCFQVETSKITDLFLQRNLWQLGLETCERNESSKVVSWLGLAYMYFFSFCDPMSFRKFSKPLNFTLHFCC